MDNSEFTDIWINTFTPQEAARKSGMTTRQVNTLARSLNLPPHETGTCLSQLDADALVDWENFESVEEFAYHNGVATVLPNLQKINAAAQRSGYPAKRLKAVARTSQGVSSQDIVADWVDWWRQSYSVPLTQSVIRSVAKEVRELIVGGYEEQEIKVGIWKWSVAFLSGGTPAPMRLIQQVAYRVRLHSSPQALSNLQYAQARDQDIDNHLQTPSPVREIEVRQW